MQALIPHLIEHVAEDMRPGAWAAAASKAGLPLHSASSEELPDAKIDAAIGHLATELDTSVEALLEAAGRAAIRPLAENHLSIFEHFDHPFDLLAALEPLVHASIRTSGRNPPQFGFVRKTPEHAILRYESGRRLGHLALGMTRGVFDWYKVEADVSCEDASGERADIHIRLDSTN